MGKNKVRIVSTSAVADASQGELATGASTIPETYNDISTTPLSFEVLDAGHKDVVLEVK